jgi:hypothetical protein
MQTNTALLLIGGTVLSLVCAILIIAKGIKDAKEIDDNATGLSQKEIDAYKKRGEDIELKQRIEAWGKKKYGSPEKKQEADEIRAILKAGSLILVPLVLITAVWVILILAK